MARILLACGIQPFGYKQSKDTQTHPPAALHIYSLIYTYTCSLLHFHTDPFYTKAFAIDPHTSSFQSQLNMSSRQVPRQHPSTPADSLRAIRYEAFSHHCDPHEHPSHTLCHEWRFRANAELSLDQFQHAVILSHLHRDEASLELYQYARGLRPDAPAPTYDAAVLSAFVNAHGAHAKVEQALKKHCIYYQQRQNGCNGLTRNGFKCPNRVHANGRFCQTHQSDRRRCQLGVFQGSFPGTASRNCNNRCGENETLCNHHVRSLREKLQEFAQITQALKDMLANIDQQLRPFGIHNEESDEEDSASEYEPDWEDPPNNAPVNLPDTLEYATIVEPDDSGEICSICQCELREAGPDADQILALNTCKHRFHKECILTWLTNRDSFGIETQYCPLDRISIFPTADRTDAKPAQQAAPAVIPVQQAAAVPDFEIDPLVSALQVSIVEQGALLTYSLVMTQQARSAGTDVDPEALWTHMPPALRTAVIALSPRTMGGLARGLLSEAQQQDLIQVLEAQPILPEPTTTTAGAEEYIPLWVRPEPNGFDPANAGAPRYVPRVPVYMSTSSDDEDGEVGEENDDSSESTEMDSESDGEERADDLWEGYGDDLDAGEFEYEAPSPSTIR